jgi:Protein of unknown function (DUF2889)
VTESLSPPAPRRLVHTRRLEIGCYKLADGTWDIEGQLVDVRPEPYDDLDQPRAANEPMHDLWLRLTIDGDGLVLKSEAAMPAGAYRHCRLVAPNYARLEGLSITKGWNKAVRERVGGTAGCTHLVSLLAQMASAAHQAVWDEKFRALAGTAQDPGRQTIDTCYAYRSDGPLVAERYPDRYTGKADTDAAD